MNGAAAGAARIALLVVLGHLLAGGVLACASALKTFDSINDPKDDTSLAHCRQVARDTKKATGGDGGAGLYAYDECAKDAGF